MHRAFRRFDLDVLRPDAEERMHCPTVATVTAVKLLTTTAISADAHPAGGRFSCELVAGHPGSHLAFAAAAQDGDQWWWLRWDGRSGRATELVQIDPCDAELPQGRYADDCWVSPGAATPLSRPVGTGCSGRGTDVGGITTPGRPPSRITCGTSSPGMSPL
jgi:hypothetical protein